MKTLTLIAAIIAASAGAATITFEGRLRLAPEWVHLKTDGASSVKETFADIISASHTTGTNANQMTSLARASGTLTNGAEVVLNLLGGVYNSFGDAVTFDRVNFLCVTAGAANVNAITVGGAASNAWESWCGTTNSVTIPAGGAVMLHAPSSTGYDVDGTNGNLRVANAGTNTVSYSVYIGGAE
jgi:hypothetical protein